MTAAANHIENIRAFWRWFSGVRHRFEKSPIDETLLSELDRQVRTFDAALAWEIGPGARKQWQLVISPDLRAEMLPLARLIVREAPKIPNWEIHATRPRKQWNYRFSLAKEDGRVVQVDAADWKYLLLRYPDGATEILLHGENVEHLSATDRERAASIVLQGAIGEDVLLEHEILYALSPELHEKFRGKEKPITDLPAAFA